MHSIPIRVQIVNIMPPKFFSKLYHFSDNRCCNGLCRERGKRTLTRQCDVNWVLCEKQSAIVHECKRQELLQSITPPANDSLFSIAISPDVSSCWKWTPLGIPLFAYIIYNPLKSMILETFLINHLTCILDIYLLFYLMNFVKLNAIIDVRKT